MQAELKRKKSEQPFERCGLSIQYENAKNMKGSISKSEVPKKVTVVCYGVEGTYFPSLHL